MIETLIQEMRARKFEIDYNLGYEHFRDEISFNNGVEHAIIVVKRHSQREITVNDKALMNAAEILANFKGEPDSTKLEEWQACYAKLFKQMAELVATKREAQPQEILGDAAVPDADMEALNKLYEHIYGLDSGSTDAMLLHRVFHYLRQYRSSPVREICWVPVDDTDVEVAIAEAIAVMEPKMDYCEKGIPVLKDLKKYGWRVMQEKKP